MSKISLRDRAKCIWANKATLAGYLSYAAGFTGAGIGLIDLANKIPPITGAVELAAGVFCASIGYGLLFVTDSGKDTYKVYNEARNHIKLFGKLSEKYIQAKKRAYCHEVGMKMALKEAGLEKCLSEVKDGI